MLINRKIISTDMINDRYSLIRYEKNDECYSCIMDCDGNEYYNEPFARETEMLSEFWETESEHGKHHPRMGLLQ